jgi:signal transduction histidine kinase
MSTLTESADHQTVHGRSHRRTSHRSIRRSLNVLTVVGAAALVAIAAVSSIALLHLVDSRHVLIDQIDPASLSADQLLLAYVDEETGVRGYLLEGNRYYLEPTQAGMTDATRAARDLNTDLSDQPTLLHMATKAEAQGRVWEKTWVQPAIQPANAHDPDFTSALSLIYEARVLNYFRTTMTSLNHQLALRRAQEANNVTTATTLLAATVGGGVLLMVGGLVVLRVFLRRWVTAPLALVSADARTVTSGDLAHPIAAPDPVEIFDLATDIEAMRQRIVDDLLEVESARTELDDRNEDLRRSNQELEQFAYVASHDLQEPLRKVTSFVQLLQQRYQGQLDDRADQYIEFAVDGALRMQQLISDLLAFSRVGRDTDRFEVVPMTDCVRHALENLESAMIDGGAHADVGRLPDIWGDRALLTSLWQNLIANSVKFHSEGAAPEVSIDAELRSERHEWQFSITDNGIGIEPRFAERVFVIFQRLHGRDSYPGTGIGLALCEKIVDFHGGRIWLDTTYRDGTRICFTLPVLETESHA